VNDVAVLADPAAVASALDPIRANMLAVLATPHSAASLATEVGLSRQKVNYHLRAMEAHGLVATVEERIWGGITERVMQAVATRLVVSPAALQPNVIDPAQAGDSLSASYLIAVSGRAVCEVGDIAARAADAGQRLPTLTIDTTVGFASASERAAFTAELKAAIVALVSRYHHDDGRLHRLIVTAYPRPEEPTS
jgi:DNA-binding transcriptional ArsR family regulator